MLLLDEDLKQFLASPVAIVIGTADRNHTPQICRGWGPRLVSDDGTIDLFLDRVPALRTLANLRENGRIAVTFTDPSDYRSIQLKGRFIEVGDASPEDRERVLRHRDDFVTVCEPYGLTRRILQNLWTKELTRVRFQATEGFDQTPGPARGRAL